MNQADLPDDRGNSMPVPTLAPTWCRVRFGLACLLWCDLVPWLHLQAGSEAVMRAAALAALVAGAGWSPHE